MPAATASPGTSLLGDLLGLIGPGTTDTQVVPVMEGPADGVPLRSAAAAQLGHDVAMVKKHTCRLALAITNYKLQGRAPPKHILTTCKSPTPPWMGLAGFYMPISRVRTAEGLRAPYHGEAGLAQLKTLKSKPQLGARV